MVIRRNALRKNLFRTIGGSIGRYIAIMLIIALGCGIFVGLRVTKDDMIVTGQKYTDGQNMFDLRLLSTYGWDQQDLEAVAALDGVLDAEGGVSVDALARMAQASEDSVYRFHRIPERINRIYLLGGRMPEKANECLVDGSRATDAILGTQLTVSKANDQDTLDSFTTHTYTVVGYISTPLYMDMTRGSTSLGSGSINTYVYLPAEALDVDYYSEIYVTIPGDWQIYSEAYNTAMNNTADAVKPELLPLATRRYKKLLSDARKEYDQGLKEYEDGVKTFKEEKENALDKLAEALVELEKGKAEIEFNRNQLLDAKLKLEEGEKLLKEQEALLEKSVAELETKKTETYQQLDAAEKELMANYKTVSAALLEISAGIRELDAALDLINDGLDDIDDAFQQIDSGKQTIDSQISLMDSRISLYESSLEAAKESAIPNETIILQLETQIKELKKQRSDLEDQREELVEAEEAAEKQRKELIQQRQTLTDQLNDLEDTQDSLNANFALINSGLAEIEKGRTEADTQFAAAQAQILDGQKQLEAGKAEIETNKPQITAGLKAVDEAQAQWNEGWAEYEVGKQEAEEKFNEAQAELDDAKGLLDEAKALIADMKAPDVYALTRESNAGYVALDNNSDIVSGVSRVFPAFFLLVAALVCITTMTRMVNEERTQIGTLKALGYKNGAIMGKYLLYTGSASVLGCALGVAVGSVVFPIILWNAYGIILNITPDVVLTVDWPLCSVVVVAYTLISLLVTWYCCRRTLKEVPAELIRPKAPTSGKKILLEYLPFWDNLKFLNKVMLRNIFRYRQRLLMMLVGIGGCTALLLTGFGVRDSIVDIVGYQFDEITQQDIEVYFSEGLNEEKQKEFRDTIRSDAQRIGFFYQSSMELDFGGRTWDLNMICADHTIQNFIDMHWEEQAVNPPGLGETCLSVGVAEAMGIRVGDTVTVRNSDMEALTLKVSGIFENYVFNYLIVSPETVEEQWNEVPNPQIAYVTAARGKDVQALSGTITGMDNVVNVSVTQEQADLVGSMMDALIVVVASIVVCAGLLAVTVLYNLTNININERIREIATIKVLGFNAKETASYVFKENICLTVVGTVLGLFGGKWLLSFVMSQIKIDMVWFIARLTPVSYVLAIVLTFLSAVIVNFIFRVKLDKINMAEALKSVE